MQLTKLIYTSNHGGLTTKALDELLLRSRANNERDGITGALIVTDEDFMQLLEGTRAAVADCFMRIMQDDRHQNIRVLLAGETDSLLFSRWSMHVIDAFQVEQDIISRYWIDGSFDPARMSQGAIEDLCRDLSTGSP